MGRTARAAEQEGARSFTRFMDLLDDGRAVPVISQQLQKLLVELKEQAEKNNTDKRGLLVLKLAFEVNEVGQVDVVYQCDTKAPTEKHGRSVYWLTEGANITADNPKQQRLPLRDVPAPKYADNDSEESDHG